MSELSLRTGLAAFAAFVFAALIATYVSASGQTEHEKSDWFWRIVSPNGMAAVEFDSPDAMAKASDLLVVARVANIEKGREWVANPDLLDDPYGAERAIARFATVTLEVE